MRTSTLVEPHRPFDFGIGPQEKELGYMSA